MLKLNLATDLIRQSHSVRAMNTETVPGGRRPLDQTNQLEPQARLYIQPVNRIHIARTLRSSDTNLLSVPRVRTCFGSRSFSVAAPTIWNSLPFDIRNSCSIVSFRRKLKTFLFSTSSHV